MRLLICFLNESYISSVCSFSCEKTRGQGGELMKDIRLTQFFRPTRRQITILKATKSG